MSGTWTTQQLATLAATLNQAPANPSQVKLAVESLRGILLSPHSGDQALGTQPFLVAALLHTIEATPSQHKDSDLGMCWQESAFCALNLMLLHNTPRVASVVEQTPSLPAKLLEVFARQQTPHITRQLILDMTARLVAEIARDMRGPFGPLAVYIVQFATDPAFSPAEVTLICSILEATISIPSIRAELSAHAAVTYMGQVLCRAQLPLGGSISAALTMTTLAAEQDPVAKVVYYTQLSADGGFHVTLGCLVECLHATVHGKEYPPGSGLEWDCAAEITICITELCSSDACAALFIQRGLIEVLRPMQNTSMYLGGPPLKLTEWCRECGVNLLQHLEWTSQPMQAKST